jgi:peroxiredoxin
MQLSAYTEKLRAEDSRFADAYDRLVARLHAGNAAGGAPRPGDVMPPFLLPDSSGRMVGLEELLGEGALVISFNRGHWCPYCELELAEYARAQPELSALNARFVTIMPERQQFLCDFVTSFAIPLTALADIDNSYALSLGLGMWVGTEVRELLIADGYRLDDYQGNDMWLLPIPATYVIGTDGIVKACFVSTDFRERMEPTAVLEALRST